jgi:hypothetical protein
MRENGLRKTIKIVIFSNKLNLMKKIFALLFLCFGYYSFSQDIQETYQRAKIFYDSTEKLVGLANLDIPVDHGIHKRDHFIISDFSISELKRAREAGYQVEVLIEDSKAHFLNRNKLSQKSTRNLNCSGTSNSYVTPSNFELGSMGGYLTYQELLDELDEMVALYPNLITAKANISTFLTEGQADNSTTPSIGGNSIKWVKISDNPNHSSEGEPQILYTSIHHAREPSTLSQLVYYMWYLLENYDSDPEVQGILDNTELYFIPVVNPDGYLYNEKTNPNGGGFWRKNRNNGYGIDNNRNYDYHINGDSNNGSWGGPGSSGNTGSSTYHGTGPFSEIENQAVKWFVEQHNFVIAINNHSFSQLLYYPFGYADVATPDDAIFQEMTSELVSRNGYFALRDYPFAGDSDDFMYGTVGTHSKIFSMTPEVGAEFWPPSNEIIGLCEEMMYMNLTAAKMVGNFATIEDTSNTFVSNTSSSVDYTIKRLGIEVPANFTVSVNPISSNIQSVGSANSHNGLTYSQEISDSIDLNLNGSIDVGDQIIYELIINNGTFDFVETITRTYGLPSVVFDELGNDTATNWTTSSWSTTTEDYVSASSSITDSPISNYGNNENSTITLSNEINLVGVIGANLSFQAKWDIENNYDYVQLEVSTNNGSSWIPQCGNYTNNGVANQNGANNEPVYDGTQNTWVQETIELSDYIGQTILLRFKLITDVSVIEDGFYFDDLQVNIVEDNLSTINFIEQHFDLFPNPTRDRLNINTQIQNYSIEVFTIQGQLIFESQKNSGNILIDYSNYSNGIYLLKLNSEDRSQTFKVIKQ